MASLIAAQTTQPYFLLTPRSSFFLCSRKSGIHRREDCKALSTRGSNCYTTIFSSSFKYERSLGYHQMLYNRHHDFSSRRSYSVNSGQSGSTAWFYEAEYIRQNKNNLGRFNNIGTNHGVSNLGTGLEAMQEDEIQCKSVDLYPGSRHLEFDNIDRRSPVQRPIIREINGPSKKSKQPYIISDQERRPVPWINDPKHQVNGINKQTSLKVIDSPRLPQKIDVHPSIIHTKKSVQEETERSYAVDSITINNGATDEISSRISTENHSIPDKSTTDAKAASSTHLQTRLGRIYDKVLIVNNIPAAKEVVRLLTNQYKHLIHACDTEVAKIEVKDETPVDHGEVICFSIYSGLHADFGDGKSCIWVYALLKEEWLQCFEEIQNVLVKFMGDAVCFNQEAATVSVNYWIKWADTNLVKLPTVLEAMDAVGVLDYGLAKIADMMIKYIITPVVKGQAIVSTTDEIDEYPENISEVVLNIVPLTDAEAEDYNGETLYCALIHVIKFVNRSLCFQNSSWMNSFGRLTWARMSKLIISSFLSKVVPDDASKLADFQNIVKLSYEFESELKELMFISSEIKDQRLSIFADNVEVHFASRKKVEILTKARELLLQSEFNIPQQFARKSEQMDVADINAHTVDLLVTSEKCIISEAAKKLMELVHQTLKDVCVSSPRVGMEFYHAARDVLLLYEAVIPVKLERQLDSVNQAAVLIHNDCLYLSSEIVGLAFEYRAAFPYSVKEAAIFVDLSPRLQMLGERVFQREIQLVLYNLKNAIDGADGFQNTHQIKQRESAKFSMDQVVFIIEKVRMIWEPLLLPSIYEKCMSMVMEAVFSKIAEDILLLDDMAAEETLQLQNLILLLLENLSPLMDSLLANKKRGKSHGGDLQLNPIPLPSMQKLRKLADLLDMPLKSITASWESGELVSCGFTSSEVKDFIRAIFTDSPLRKECLFRIENS